MKIKNTTDFPDWFLRRMISWVCSRRIIEWSPRKIREATYRNSSGLGGSGLAYTTWGEFRVSVMPVRSRKIPKEGMREVYDRDRIRSLVSLTAHEITHLTQEIRVLRGKNCEGNARWQARQVKEEFIRNEDELVAKWMKPPAYATKPKKAKPPVQEVRYERAKKNLANWERKAKLAKTKIQKYRKQVRYYEKALGVETEAETSKAACRREV
jgi:hypothetical protein